MSRIDDGDQTLFRVFGHPISINEWHCWVLALIGIPLGIVGYVYVLLTLCLIALFCSKGHSIGLKTIVKEPWHFVGVIVITFSVAYYCL